MSSSEAGRPSRGDKSQESCAHMRVIENELSEDGAQTRRFICKECGVIIPRKGERPD